MGLTKLLSYVDHLRTKTKMTLGRGGRQLKRIGCNDAASHHMLILLLLPDGEVTAAPSCLAPLLHAALKYINCSPTICISFLLSSQLNKRIISFKTLCSL
jgi:hypothetical protein